MKVLHVINHMGTGGAEKLLLEAMPFYTKQAFTNDVLLLKGKSYPFLTELRKQDISVFDLGNGSLYNPLLIFKIIAHIKSYDVVHVHLFPSLYWVGLAKKIAFFKGKLIYTEHSTSNRRRDKWLFKMLDKWIYKEYSKIVCITTEVAENIKKHLGWNTSDKFQVIENGVNLSKIQTAQPYATADFFPHEPEAKIIIQIARFFPPKDHATLIKALALLPKNVKLLLVGDGVLKSEAEQLVNDLKLQDRVQFLGVRLDVHQLLKTADIGVLSSAYEGMSLSGIEGMASSKPFIASNVPGLAEMVRGAGLLFEFGNPEALAGHIKKLLADTDFYNAVAASCQVKAATFDIAKMANQYTALYHEQ